MAHEQRRCEKIHRRPALLGQPLISFIQKQAERLLVRQKTGQT
jgi:hypothetical protein